MVRVPLMFLSELREFSLAPWIAEKKIVDRSCLHAVEISRVVAWHASIQYKKFIRDTTKKKKIKSAILKQLKCGKTDRTHYTESGVRAGLRMVAWKNCEMNMKR